MVDRDGVTWLGIKVNYADSRISNINMKFRGKTEDSRIMRKIITIAVVLLMIFPTISSATANNGVALLKECTAYIHLKDNIRDEDGQKADSTDANSCLNYMYGVVDVLYYYIPFYILEKRDLREKATHNICLPEKFDIDDAIRVVVAYLEAHPNDLNWHKMGLILPALQDEFPCTD